MNTATWTAFFLSIAFVTAPALAAPPAIDVSNHRIICRTVFGTASFKPALTYTPTDNVVTVKGTIDGCSDLTNSSVIITASPFSGKIALTGNSCNDFLSSVNVGALGTVTIKWKTDKTTPITPTSTTLDIGNVNPTLFNAGAPVSATLAAMRVDYFPITGAFANGMITQPFLWLIASQDTGAFGPGCDVGIKKLNIGLGRFTAS